jgi:hypothetical protein
MTLEKLIKAELATAPRCNSHYFQLNDNGAAGITFVCHHCPEKVFITPDMLQALFHSDTGYNLIKCHARWMVETNVNRK